jgi:excinuclease UvrABC helicase subunit UvrB
MHLEKWRPYILRMNAVASAMIQWEAGLHDQALGTVQAAVRRIQLIEEWEDETFKFEQERSLIALQELAREIQNSRPVTEIELLEQEMQQAIETQAFEHAAELRDRLRELRQPKPPKP